MTDQTTEDGEALWTITEAGERAGVSRSTIRRALDRGDLPNARRMDEEDDPRRPWLIPTGDLDAAGYPAVEDDEEEPEDQDAAGEPARAQLISMEVYADLLARIDSAYHEAHEAEVRALRAEHRAETASEELAELEAAADQARERAERAAAVARRWRWATIAAGAVSVAAAAAVVAAVAGAM